VFLLVGVLLLLHNFLLLPNLNIVHFLPLLLVLLGLQILLRGDYVPSEDTRTFGITRGKVESAILEVSAGEIDVTLQAMATRNTERLIAGQYANHARPELRVSDIQAYLKLDRARTPWLSFADWELVVSPDLPWQIYVSTSLGQVNADLGQVIVQKALLCTGFGDIRLTAPREAFEPIMLNSTLGSIHVVTPQGYRVRVSVKSGRLFHVQVDPRRYEAETAYTYLARDAEPDAPMVEILLHGSIGDAYLV
jgi:hypothetical protein